MTHVDLFSGIGGFTLAAQAAGFETIAFSEIEPYACKILTKHWPKIPNLGDCRVIDGTKYRGVSLLTGGIPCQPWSQAGDKRGSDDARHLWPTMLGFVESSRPVWVVIENVNGFVDLGACDACCDDLEARNYAVGPPLVIPACAVGAPHERERVWIIAHDNGAQQQPFMQSNGRRKRQPKGHSPGADSDTHAMRKLQPQGGQQDEWRRSDNIPEGCFWERHWSDRFMSLLRMDDGVSRRLDETKPVGNAIVPQVAEVILKAIAESIRSEA